MSVMDPTRGFLLGPVLRFIARLRFPYMFIITAILFLVDLALPDVIPFADELLLGLLAIILGSIRKKRPR